MDQALEVRNLSKRFITKKKRPGLGGAVKNILAPEYRKIDAVADISFQVERGDILAFIGPNGAGKSTTIKLITGILYPDSGSIRLLGLDPHRHRRKLAYRIGTVFGQKSQLWFHLPPIDSFYLLGSIYDMERSETKRRVKVLSDIFEIGDLLDQPVRKLSLGQRIRCEIAGSLIHSPEILFLDEPSIGLDVVVKQRIRDLMLRINRENGVTIFLTSHDAGDIEKICRRAMVINKGQIVWDDTIKRMKYSLLDSRIIDVKYEHPMDISIPGVRVLKRKDYSAKLEVDTKVVSLDRVLQKLVKDCTIQDITISHPPMEEVISRIYEGSL